MIIVTAALAGSSRRLAFVCLAMVCGCLMSDLGAAQDLPIDYGKRRGEGRGSLNGMSGFASMWEAQGATV